jgi:hypothetical protein
MTAARRLFHNLRPQGIEGLSLLGVLLMPVAVAAAALAAWRFGADAGWTSRFFIGGGFLSHWQVWCAFAISAEACAYVLSQVSPRWVRAAS